MTDSLPRFNGSAVMAPMAGTRQPYAAHPGVIDMVKEVSDLIPFLGTDQANFIAGASIAIDRVRSA